MSLVGATFHPYFPCCEKTICSLPYSLPRFDIDMCRCKCSHGEFERVGIGAGGGGGGDIWLLCKTFLVGYIFSWVAKDKEYFFCFVPACSYGLYGVLSYLL